MMSSFLYSNKLKFRGILVTSGSFILGNRYQATGLEKENNAHTPPITLYQYQSCPFCSKTRAFLDYYGIKYRKVEVNPLFKREMKFSSYKKVPFVVVDSPTEGVGSIQINDSSLLISVLRSYMMLKSDSSLPAVLDMYPEMKYTNEKGKDMFDRANKYFIMYGEHATDGRDVGARREERQWREWVDTNMVHTLSPNIYRSPREALQAFGYMSHVGNFSSIERIMAKYVGAIVMFALSKRIKKKYGLKDDVRQSLYDCCEEWMKAIGEHRQFMGGDYPNLADLAVYGILNAIEGLDAFNDVMSSTKISKWYQAVKDRVNSHEGAAQH